MSARQTIDSLQFARTGGQLSGELQAEECMTSMPRLRDILRQETASVRYRLTGGVHNGRPVLHLQAWATLYLVCQGCLEPYDQALVMDRTYPIARDEAELARWERDDPLLEALQAEPRMSVLELVEDEILLSVPTVPHHPAGECGLDGQVPIQ